MPVHLCDYHFFPSDYTGNNVVHTYCRIGFTFFCAPFIVFFKKMCCSCKRYDESLRASGCALCKLFFLKLLLLCGREDIFSSFLKISSLLSSRQKYFYIFSGKLCNNFFWLNFCSMTISHIFKSATNIINCTSKMPL